MASPEKGRKDDYGTGGKAETAGTIKTREEKAQGGSYQTYKYMIRGMMREPDSS